MPQHPNGISRISTLTRQEREKDEKKLLKFRGDSVSKSILGLNMIFDVLYVSWPISLVLICIYDNYLYKDL